MGLLEKRLSQKVEVCFLLPKPSDTKLLLMKNYSETIIFAKSI